jgi:hypothetical protein
MSRTATTDERTQRDIRRRLANLDKSAVGLCVRLGGLSKSFVQELDIETAVAKFRAEVVVWLKQDAKAACDADAQWPVAVLTAFSGLATIARTKESLLDAIEREGR